MNTRICLRRRCVWALLALASLAMGGTCGSVNRTTGALFPSLFPGRGVDPLMNIGPDAGLDSTGGFGGFPTIPVATPLIPPTPPAPPSIPVATPFIPPAPPSFPTPG